MLRLPRAQAWTRVERPERLRTGVREQALERLHVALDKMLGIDEA